VRDTNRSYNIGIHLLHANTSKIGIRRSTTFKRLVLTFSDEFPNVSTNHKWPENFPYRDRPGVYFMFDADLSLLYVGMTKARLQMRISKYFRRMSRLDHRCRINEKMLPAWNVRPCYVRTLAVTNALEAPILEDFLIDTLRPSENWQSKRRAAKFQANNPVYYCPSQSDATGSLLAEFSFELFHGGQTALQRVGEAIWGGDDSIDIAWCIRVTPASRRRGSRSTANRIPGRAKASRR